MTDLSLKLGNYTILISSHSEQANSPFKGIFVALALSFQSDQTGNRDKEETHLLVTLRCHLSEQG